VASRRAAGDLESEVLAALWAAQHPLTPADVLTALDDPALAYTTVQTILTRLLAKGAVQRERVGRAHAYRPVLDDAGMIANRMRAAMDKGDDSAAVLAHFLGTLSADEQTLLSKLLGRRPRRDRP
jgi:predicted transcriptional regulator